ncbi:MAG: cytidylate kinase-like family protein [Bacteroidota bacterium]
MGNSLMNYLNKRLKEENSFDEGKAGLAGPLITISREVGCNGLVLARLIATRLNKRRLQSDWKVLSKEIFHESAKELDLEPEKVRQTFKKTDRYTFEQILKAFSDKRYKSEEKIIKTVRDVVRTLAIDGFCIIVGRASHIITSDIHNALHVRLTAPLDYRVNTIMTNNKLNKNEAIAFIEKVEKERIAFRKALREESLQEDIFDLIINRASFSNEQAVDIIEYAIDKKQILTDYKQKIEFY